MKPHAVFYIREGRIAFLQASKAEVIDTAGQSDAQISQTLSDFIKTRKLNFSASRVTLVVPRSQVILRHMTLPSQKADEIRSMIDLQVDGRIPFVREEVEIDFQILSKTADGYAKVAAVVIPQETAMRYWKIFSDAKIPIHGMTISSVGLWLLYRQQTDVSEKLGAILDLDVDHTEICLCYKTHWLTSREIPAGPDAEILKQWELTQNNTNGEKLTVAGPVYLAGAAGRARTLGIETAKEVDVGVSMAPLAGIASSSQMPPINLIPKAVRQSQEQSAYRRQLVILGIWAAAALLSLGLALGVGSFRKNAQLAVLEDQLRDAKREALKVERQLQKIHDIETLLKGRLVFSDLAHELGRLLPAQVYLVSMAISDGNVLSLQGVSSSPVEINQFQKDMVDSQRFSNVSLDYVNKRVTQQGEVNYFKITCTL